MVVLSGDPRGARLGFSLVEALIAIAILGLLIAILLPAVNRVRESARRAQCMNNLRQLGVAAVSYESAHGSFPPGYLGPKPARDQKGDDWYGTQQIGALVYLLPYLELGNLTAAITTDMNVDHVTGPPWWRSDRETLNEQHLKVARTRIPSLLCPSTNPNQNSYLTITALNYYPASKFRMETEVAGFCASQKCIEDGNGVPDIATAKALGRTNYLGCAGGFGGNAVGKWKPFNGMLTNRSKVRAQHIRDGSSKTLLFGEAAGDWLYDPSKGTQLKWLEFSWMGVGTLPLFEGVIPIQRCTDGVFREFMMPGWYQFSSEHLDQIHFCFVDGSVRPLSVTIDYNTLIYLGGIADSRSINTTELE